jgi:hypothetical protein
MKNHIHKLIRGLSSKHILQNSPQTYVDDFVVAALEVYDAATVQKTLQHKFFIPDESNYSDEAYYRSASELSVSNYLKRLETENLVTNFECDKKVNPPSPKDVDNYFQVGMTRVSLEVKCPQEDKQATFPGTITLRSAGRLPDPAQMDHMRDMLESGSSGASGTKYAMGKNPDHRMKECLVSANDKFSSASGVDDLNILFVSCGQFNNMNEWHLCLYGTQGLFTAHSFAPEARCPRVDIVMLSNLRYRHEESRAHPAWTLDDVLLLPIVNPHGRSNCTSEAVKEGLGVFHHYQKEFASFNGSELIWDKHSKNRVNIQNVLKVNYFVMEYLKAEEFSRFFPTIDRATFKSPGL